MISKINKRRRISMKKFIIGINLILILFFISGCSKVIIKSDSDPNTNFAAIKKYYVQKSPTDNRGLEKIIVERLNKFGFQATSGIDTKPSYPVDALVIYKDRWMWDMTMYMLEISIELHDPNTNFIFSSGKSYRTSLARKSPEFMIDEVLRDIFKGKINLPEN